MTRLVLLIGAVWGGSLTLVWLVFCILPTMPDTGIANLDGILHTLRIFAAINRYDRVRTPFDGLGGVIQLWFVALAVAVVMDRYGKAKTREVVSAFASHLSLENGQVGCTVSQSWEGIDSLLTITSGTFHGRCTTVLVSQASRVSYLRLDIACRAVFALAIRKRNIVSEALAWAGAPLETGDEALDKAVVFQGDDVAAIRRWACQSDVRLKMLSLFETYGTTSVTTSTGTDEEPILRAEYARFRPRFFPTANVSGILNELDGLATSAEAESISEHRP